MRATNSRARSALIMILVLVASLYFSSLYWLLPLIAWLVALLATCEIYRMGLHKGIHSSLVLAEFATTVDNLEEVFENREQIEISKFYERMPKPTTTAIEEFLEGKLMYRMREEEAPKPEV